MGGAAAALEHAGSPEELRPRPPACAEIHPARTAAERLRQQWQELALAAAESNVFAELWFVEASLRNLEVHSDPRMIEVWRGETLLGLLPLCISASYGRLPLRNAQNWLHPQSFLGTPLVRAGHEEEFWVAVLDILDREPWARSFLHLSKLTEDGPVFAGLVAASARLRRRCDIVHRFERALLESPLSPDAYYERTVRKKKRKELKRLSNRLAELGNVEARRLASPGEVSAWCDDFLALESAGWKGQAGSALGCSEGTERFFRDLVSSAFEQGKLDFLRLDLDGKPLAMLVNLLAPPGGFSFKIAFDEAYARFSPGILIEIENLRILEDPRIAWMDSCAVEDHPMINSFWAERRRIVSVTVQLRGTWRGLLFRMCRSAEQASAAVRRLRHQELSKPEDQDND